MGAQPEHSIDDHPRWYGSRFVVSFAVRGMIRESTVVSFALCNEDPKSVSVVKKAGRYKSSPPQREPLASAPSWTLSVADTNRRRLGRSRCFTGMVGEMERRRLPLASRLLFFSLLSGTATMSAGEAASFCTKMLQQITPMNYSTLLQAEVKSYEQSAKFRNKIDELNGRKKVDWDSGGRIGEIATALRKVVDKSVHSILDLGAGPGLITRYAQQLAAKVHGPSGAVRIDGVELVHGWVSAARDFASTRPVKGTHFHFQQADITNISLGATYDLIYMADSIEHVPKFRRGALWQVLAAHSHTGSRLYLHFPNVKMQLAEQRRQHTPAHISIGKGSGRRLQQYFEEVLELNDVVKAGCCVGFCTKHYKDHGNGKSGYVSFHLIKEGTALLRDCRKGGPRTPPGE